MSLARATISGTVYRAPEKRFTSNNVPITAFTININPDDETLIRVIAFGNLADSMVNSIRKGDVVVVEGRLQNNTVKDEAGNEKRIVEIDASSFEKISSGSNSTSSGSSNFGESEQIVKFGADEFSESLIGDEEIPF